MICKICKEEKDKNEIEDCTNLIHFIKPINPNVKKEDMYICKECLKKFEVIMKKVKSKRNERQKKKCL